MEDNQKKGKRSQPLCSKMRTSTIDSILIGDSAVGKSK